MNSSVKPENISPVQTTFPTSKRDVVTGETVAATSEAAPRPLVFQRSVCTLSSDHCSHTAIRGNKAEQRLWGGWAWSPAPLASKSEENSENWRQGRNGCRQQREAAEEQAGLCSPGQGGPGAAPLTSTRRPMLAMCGEQSLTVSSFSICKDTSFSQRKQPATSTSPIFLHLSPLSPGAVPVCHSPLVAGGSVELLSQGHFSSTNDSFWVVNSPVRRHPKALPFLGQSLLMLL